MKTFIIKIDQTILDQVTIHIRKWIEKHDYKKHKIDFMLKVEWIEFYLMIILAIMLPLIIYTLDRNFIQAGVHITIWGCLAVFKYFNLKFNMQEFKAIHDQHFSMRKNPEFYRMEKEVLEEMFVSSRKSRLRQILFLLTINFLAVFLVTLIVSSGGADLFVFEYLFASTCITIFNIYLFFVFDFEEPKPKKKKKLAALTDLVMKAIKDAVESLSPVPNPI